MDRIGGYGSEGCSGMGGVGRWVAGVEVPDVGGSRGTTGRGDEDDEDDDDEDEDAGVEEGPRAGIEPSGRSYGIIASSGGIVLCRAYRTAAYRWSRTVPACQRSAGKEESKVTHSLYRH
jgi:hypothetical protein